MANNISRHTDRLKVELLLLDELEKRSLLEEYHVYIEAAFFERYFLNTVDTMISRQGGMAFSLWKLMCEQLLFHFPTFMDNPIIHKKNAHLYIKNWSGIIVQGVIINRPGLWQSTRWHKECEELKKYSFIDLIVKEDLTQSQWELVQFCNMMLQRLGAELEDEG